MYERLGLDDIPLIKASPAITKCVKLAIANGLCLDFIVGGLYV